MKSRELRPLAEQELERLLEDSYKELFNLRFRLSTWQLTNVREVREVRKRIARIKTLLRERELVLEEGGSYA